MSADALTLISALRKDLDNLYNEAKTSRDTTTARERAKRWHERAVRQLRESVSPIEADRLEKTELRSFSMGDPIGNLGKLLAKYDAVLTTLAEEIGRDPSFLKAAANADATATAEKATKAEAVINPRRVFIVHGHDEGNTLKLKALLQDRFKLDPIVMSGAPGRGRTLIEKFEQVAAECAFAFVLLTPDDQVKTGGGEYTQARPNVLFELGWFYGRLGRANVVLVLREGTSIHSDLDGVSRIQFLKSVEEKVIEIERELQAANILPAST